MSELNHICLTEKLNTKFNHLWQLVGNTPMLKIHYMYRGRKSFIYVKCEQYNLTGSIKDRMALYTLHQSYHNCLLKPSDKIIEATSGNTGISFSAIGRALGHEVTIIMPNWLSKERVDIIKSYGAKIQLVSKEEGGFLGSIAISRNLAESDPQVFLPRQFENIYNIEAHRETTGEEIIIQLVKKGILPDAFVAGVGTGGTIMGVGQALKKFNPKVKIHPLEPAESPTLSTGYKVGSHRIQGISDEFIPAIVKLNELDGIISAQDGDAIIMAQKLASELGLAVGISSGANVIGAIKIKEELGADANVVTVLSDSNKKYLSTDLVKNELVKPGYYSSEVKFVDYESMGRLSDPPFSI